MIQSLSSDDESTESTPRSTKRFKAALEMAADVATVAAHAPAGMPDFASAGADGRTFSALGHFVSLTKMPWRTRKENMLTLRSVMALTPGNEDEVEVCDGLLAYIDRELKLRGL